MKKIFLKYYKKLDSHYPFEGSQTANFELQDLHLWLRMFGFDNLTYVHNGKGMHFEHLHFYTILESSSIQLWSSFHLKQQANIEYDIQEEFEVFNRSYDAYYDKRWNDMPKLVMSLQNYEVIVQKWQEIIKEKPIYLIISQDDHGYVDLVGKQELSQQDLHDMKLEHDKFLKYQIAWEKYDAAHPNRSEVWRSPADDEYEADWQKYLDDPIDEQGVD